jgi:drug/metabolite transporter (DMT)-like permease
MAATPAQAWTAARRADRLAAMPVPHAPRDRLDAGAIALIILLCATWGVAQSAMKFTTDGISPLFQGGLRSIGATLIIGAWCAARGVGLFRRDAALPALLLCGALFAFEFALLYAGLALTTASRGVVFLYTAPCFVALGAHLFLKNDRLTPVRTIGLACAMAGLAIAFADSLRLPSARELLGDTLCLGAAIGWAATILVMKAKLASEPPERVLFYQLLVSAITLPPVALALGEPGIFAATPAIWGAMAFQIILVASASYLAWFWMVANYPASRLSAFTFLTPVFGVAAGAVLLGETITPALATALTLIGAGIWLLNRPPRSR